MLALGQLALDGLQHLADHFAAVAARRLDGLGEHRVAVGVAGAESDRSSSSLVEVVQPEAVGDRARRFPGFRARCGGCFVGCIDVQRAHVVQAVGQLDQDHAHIARHGQQHLAEVFGLGVALAWNSILSSLDTPSTSSATCLPKSFGDLRRGDGGVFHHVVQQRGDQGLGVELPAGQDVGDRQRMGDVGLRRICGIGPWCGLGGEFVGAPKGLAIGDAEVGDRRGQRGKVFRSPLFPSGVRLLEDFRTDQTFGDLAQGDDGRLVLVRVDLGRRAGVDLAGAVSRGQGQFQSGWGSI